MQSKESEQHQHHCNGFALLAALPERLTCLRDQAAKAGAARSRRVSDRAAAARGGGAGPPGRIQQPASSSGPGACCCDAGNLQATCRPCHCSAQQSGRQLPDQRPQAGPAPAQARQPCSLPCRPGPRQLCPAHGQQQPGPPRAAACSAAGAAAHPRPGHIRAPGLPAEQPCHHGGPRRGHVRVPAAALALAAAAHRGARAAAGRGLLRGPAPGADDLPGQVRAGLCAPACPCWRACMPAATLLLLPPQHRCAQPHALVSQSWEPTRCWSAP